MLTGLCAHEIGDERPEHSIFFFSSFQPGHSFPVVRRILNQLAESDTVLKLSTEGLKVLFDLSMARDLIAASARYGLIFY